MIPVHFRGLLAAYDVCLCVLSTKESVTPCIGNPRVSQLKPTRQGKPCCQINETIANVASSILEYFEHNYEINLRILCAFVGYKCHTISAYHNIVIGVIKQQCVLPSSAAAAAVVTDSITNRTVPCSSIKWNRNLCGLPAGHCWIVHFLSAKSSCQYIYEAFALRLHNSELLICF